MNKIKILIVDDESRMRKLVHDFLAKQGYVVLEAENGEDAVDIFFSDKNIDLIILDVMMPVWMSIFPNRFHLKFWLPGWRQFYGVLM